MMKIATTQRKTVGRTTREMIMMVKKAGKRLRKRMKVRNKTIRATGIKMGDKTREAMMMAIT